jgi:hypothetical protein
MINKNLIVFGVVAFIFIFFFTTAQANPSAKLGNQGLPACLDKVNQLEQNILELQTQNKVLQSLIDAYKNYAPVARTGETTCNNSSERNDGCLQKGVESPSPRFTDNNDGTVKDNLTRLVWMKNMSCWEQQSMHGALPLCNNLELGNCGVLDNSVKGEWRLPNRNELLSLVDIETSNGHTLSDGHPFINYCGGPPMPGFPCGDRYWSSSTAMYNFGAPAYYVHLGDGTSGYDSKAAAFYGVWCVRDSK